LKYLLWADAVLAAVGATMTIAVGFVALVFSLYIDASPITRQGLSGVLIITSCFAVLFVVAVAATLGVKRARNWHWPLQALLALSLPLMWTIVTAQLRSP
jgi:predicted tellurium resistance membrane protein TerC